MSFCRITFIMPLMDSLKRVGLLQPITITPDGHLICGFRRLEAAKAFAEADPATTTHALAHGDYRVRFAGDELIMLAIISSNCNSIFIDIAVRQIIL